MNDDDKPFPSRRMIETVECEFEGIRFYMTLGFYPGGRVGEIQVSGFKHGAHVDLMMQDASGFVTNLGYTASITFSSAPPSTAPSMSSGQYSLQVWGNVTGMTTNYTEVNEGVAGGDVSCVTSSTVSAEDRYSFNSLSGTPASIAGVKVSGMLRKTDSGARTITMQLKSGGTEVTGSSQSPSTSYLYYASYQDTTPAGASCTLTRHDETLGTINPTPGSLYIEKTKYDITITCNKKGYETATYLNHSGVAGATVGNIILGGGIGWAVDSATGADNKYDTPVNISLSKK